MEAGFKLLIYELAGKCVMQELNEQEAVILREMRQPHRCLHYLRPGRLVAVREGSVDWGWGVLVNVTRAGRPSNGHGADLIGTSGNDPTDNYIMDVLLPCAPGKPGDPKHPRP